jgi:hypothetical protein
MSWAKKYACILRYGYRDTATVSALGTSRSVGYSYSVATDRNSTKAHTKYEEHHSSRYCENEGTERFPLPL